MTDSRQTVIDAIGEVAPDVDAAGIVDDEDLWFSLDLDSMDRLNVMVAISQRTGASIPEADYPQLVSVNDIVEYLSAMKS